MSQGHANNPPSRDPRQPGARSLPITSGAKASGTPITDEATIRALVDAFYDVARTDDLLGPIFAAHIQDWKAHLERLYAFWASVVLLTGTYSGRPTQAHMHLPGLGQAHFDRWLDLWKQTIDRVVPPHARDAFLIPAQGMARVFAAALPAGGPTPRH
jgi:hemoglobin